jgi:hypothetical protein
MRHIPARPEQPQSSSHYPFFERAGSDAAVLWLQSAPLSIGEFRDLRFRNLVTGLGALDNAAARRHAFNEGFSRCIALAIASQSRAEVRHV